MEQLSKIRPPSATEVNGKVEVSITLCEPTSHERSSWKEYIFIYIHHLFLYLWSFLHLDATLGKHRFNGTRKSWLWSLQSV